MIQEVLLIRLNFCLGKLKSEDLSPDFLIYQLSLF